MKTVGPSVPWLYHYYFFKDGPFGVRPFFLPPPRSMTKKDLIKKTASKAGIDGVKAEKAVNTAMMIIGNELKKGNCVRIRKFGRFGTVGVSPKKCRHPETGELIEIPARRKVKFTSGKNLKNTLNAGNTAGKEKKDSA